VLPDSIGAESITSEAAELQFNVHILDASVSKEHIPVQLGQHLFVGDILANKHHSWLELGLIDNWISTLKNLNSIKYYN